MHATRLLALLLLLLAAAAKGDTYVVPFWATGLGASDGTWWVQATVVNPSGFPVSYRVSRLFPMLTVDCDSCEAPAPEIVLQPFQSTPLTPTGLSGQRMTAGAFEITSSGPLVVTMVAYRPGPNEIRQRLAPALRWLGAGEHRISTVERVGPNGRINVFVTNPTTDTSDVAVWAGDRAENEVRLRVPPLSTRIVRLPPLLCGGQPCGEPAIFPPPPMTIHVQSTTQTITSVSSVGNDWAVFAVADEALLP